LHLLCFFAVLFESDEEGEDAAMNEPRRGGVQQPRKQQRKSTSPSTAPLQFGAYGPNDPKVRREREATQKRADAMARLTAEIEKKKKKEKREVKKKQKKEEEERKKKKRKKKKRKRRRRARKRKAKKRRRKKKKEVEKKKKERRRG